MDPCPTLNKPADRCTHMRDSAAAELSAVRRWRTTVSKTRAPAVCVCVCVRACVRRIET